MDTPTFDSCRWMFDPSTGALRELFIVDTDESDWQRILDHLSATQTPFRLFKNEDPEIPVDPGSVAAKDLLDEDLDLYNTYTLRFEPKGVPLWAHFWDDAEIEFTFSAEDINSETFTPVLDFMREISTIVAKPIKMTYMSSSGVGMGALIEFSPKEHSFRVEEEQS